MAKNSSQAANSRMRNMLASIDAQEFQYSIMSQLQALAIKCYSLNLGLAWYSFLMSLVKSESESHMLTFMALSITVCVQFASFTSQYAHKYGIDKTPGLQNPHALKTDSEMLKAQAATIEELESYAEHEGHVLSTTISNMRRRHTVRRLMTDKRLQLARRRVQAARDEVAELKKIHEVVEMQQKLRAYDALAKQGGSDHASPPPSSPPSSSKSSTNDTASVEPPPPPTPDVEVTESPSSSSGSKHRTSVGSSVGGLFRNRSKHKAGKAEKRISLKAEQAELKAEQAELKAEQAEQSEEGVEGEESENSDSEEPNSKANI